ncbi:UPF0280 family protein [Bacteroidota bacterium]
MSYEERKYRNILNKDRFDYCNLLHLETDLWIGVGKGACNEYLKQIIRNDIASLRAEIEAFIQRHPEFKISFSPLRYKEKTAGPIAKLINASNVAGTGPMAGIAGLFSENIGHKIKEYTSNAEVLVENGGDIFSSTKAAIVISIYAGSSPLSNKIALNIPKGEWGICTSSGTVGHSRSFGQADAVTVVAKSTVLADAIATQIANQVKSPEDIQAVLEDSAKYEGIEGVVIVCGEKIGLTGKLEIVPV